MSPKPVTKDTLFYSDNLFILREHILHHGQVQMPPQFGTFKQAQRVRQTSDLRQAELRLG